MTELLKVITLALQLLFGNTLPQLSVGVDVVTGKCFAEFARGGVAVTLINSTGTFVLRDNQGDVLAQSQMPAPPTVKRPLLSIEIECPK